jgi:hypothetical protein
MILLAHRCSRCRLLFGIYVEHSLDRSNAANAYSDCLRTQLSTSRGLHLAVKSATKNDVSLLVSWNPQGRDPATITPSWIWAGKGKDQLQARLQQGLTTVVLPRPAQAHTFAVNYPGFTDSVVLEPLAKLGPTELAPIIVTETYDDPAGERPSGECDNYSVYYSVCTPEKPAGWKIVNCNFSLSGNRAYGAAGAEAKEQSKSETRICWQFRLQGHSEECRGGHGNTGIQHSRAHLTVTWQHPR